MKKKLSIKICVIVIGFMFPINAYCANMYLQPCGQAIGVKMYTDGLIVVDICSVTTRDGHQKYCKEVIKGDVILSADGKKLSSASDLKNIISKSPKNINLKLKRNGKVIDVCSEIMIAESGPTLGLWLRDSAAGIGTLTYYNPDTGDFGALGHGICDVDTAALMPTLKGTIIDCDVTNVIKSNRGVIGELECSFSNNKLGEIASNTHSGLFGKVEINTNKLMEVASNDEITQGSATILCEVDKSGIREFDIQIKKIDKYNKNGRNMIVEITDEKLLDITGGIVQGMSGSPVVQNGKLVGAVTHVFVNDPTRGYGIFIENMLAEAEENQQ